VKPAGIFRDLTSISIENLSFIKILLSVSGKKQHQFIIWK
jgi:hypothetical protein